MSERAWLLPRSVRPHRYSFPEAPAGPRDDALCWRTEIPAVRHGLADLLDEVVSEVCAQPGPAGDEPGVDHVEDGSATVQNRRAGAGAEEGGAGSADAGEVLERRTECRFTTEDTKEELG